jgi:hypothetical protein
LDGVAVVATQDATFVAPLDRSQDVRKIVARLEQAGRVEARCGQAREAVCERRLAANADAAEPES